jgi:hypothetical protein
MAKRADLFIAPIGEGALILVVAVAGWITHGPLVFSSLGPTAYELIEKPEAKSARTYNIIAGHCVGLAAGYFALWLLHAWSSPKVASAGFVAGPRIWAAVLAVTVTTFVTLAIRASQPASLSTTLLVALGSMQTAKDALAIAAAVVIMAAVGEPLRRLRLKEIRQAVPGGDGS